MLDKVGTFTSDDSSWILVSNLYFSFLVSVPLNEFLQMADSSHKIAERLILINNRCVGILTRLYNIKKSCGNVNSRPKVLTEKSFEQALSVVTKRFPIVDLKKNSSAFSSVDDAKIEILKTLNPYYYTFVHLLELKEQVLQQLTLMDANQFLFDIVSYSSLLCCFYDLF